jgi:hypothetical protein
MHGLLRKLRKPLQGATGCLCNKEHSGVLAFWSWRSGLIFHASTTTLYHARVLFSR